MRTSGTKLGLAGALVVATLAGWPAAPAHADGFRSHVDHLTGGRPFDVDVADVTGDGRADLVTANYGDDTVSVLPGDGHGGFPVYRLIPTGQFSGPRAVAVADVTGDGRRDIVTANAASRTVGVLAGDGAGGFTREDFGTGRSHSPSDVAVGDVTGDGRPDIVTSSVTSTISVLAADGRGGFAEWREYSTGAGTYPQGIALGDLTGDGRLDVATGNFADTVSVLANDGGGGFSSPSVLPSGRNAWSVAIGDVTADGRPDIVTSGYYGTVSVHPGLGAGGFAERREYQRGMEGHNEGGTGVAVGDVTGDGRADVVATNARHFSSLSVFVNDGRGGLLPPADHETGLGSSPFAVVIGDLDGDGHPDLATANNGVSSASVLLGIPPAPPPQPQPEPQPEPQPQPQPEPQPQARCVVPELDGLRLPAARQRLRAGRCRLGDVGRPQRSRKAVVRKRKAGLRLRVAGQSPRAGAELAPGTEVTVRLRFGRPGA